MSAYRNTYHVWCGDPGQKTNLVEMVSDGVGFDNRPLKFEEFKELAKQVIYVSATCRL